MKTFKIAPVLLCVLCLTFSNSFAQKSYKWMKKKCSAATITDAGELYSTYDLKKEISTLNLKPEQEKEILANCNENQWSGAMKDLDSRVDNPDIIRQFKVFKVGELGDVVLLIAPAKVNQGLPKNFSQSKDIFIVISKKGISAK